MTRAFLCSLLCGAILATTPASASAQTVDDDVRCLLLSASYARLAKDDKTRHASSMTGAFFLGRLRGRVSSAALGAAVRAQGKGLAAKEAQPAMRACAARAGEAEKQMSDAIRRVEAGS